MTRRSFFRAFLPAAAAPQILIPGGDRQPSLNIDDLVDVRPRALASVTGGPVCPRCGFHALWTSSATERPLNPLTAEPVRCGGCQWTGVLPRAFRL